MPAVMMAPVMMPRAIAADLARAVIGPDGPAVAARPIIIGRRITVIARTEVVAMVPVGAARREIMPADSRRGVTVSATAAAEDMTGAKAAAAVDDATPEGAA